MNVERRGQKVALDSRYGTLGRGRRIEALSFSGFRACGGLASGTGKPKGRWLNGT